MLTKIRKEITYNPKIYKYFKLNCYLSILIYNAYNFTFEGTYIKYNMCYPIMGRDPISIPNNKKIF